jgi:hypothetical protein
MSKMRPLEGYFVCGSSRGILMTTDCLGREFTSRTANYDLVVGLPQLDTVQWRGQLRPPRWTCGPEDEDESEGASERDPFFWGRMPFGLIDTLKRALATDQDLAFTDRCRFCTSLTASTDEEFDAAARDFVMELSDWRTHFASWVQIVTSQDFVGLGGHAEPLTRSPSISTWTANADGQRARIQTYMPHVHMNPIRTRPLELHDLQSCVTATGNQGAPPAEWLFIRDARSLLSGGQNRRAVIDAATAAELAMNTLIDQYHSTTNTDELVKKALEKRCRSLEGCMDVLKTLRTRLLAGGLQDGLIKPRNQATHGGHSLTDEQAQTAVDMATDIVQQAYPLADLLPTQ